MLPTSHARRPGRGPGIRARHRCGRPRHGAGRAESGVAARRLKLRSRPGAGFSGPVAGIPLSAWVVSVQGCLRGLFCG